MQPDFDKHPTDLQKACMAFIASLKEPAASHSIYGQTRISPTGAVEQVIIIHRHPVHARLEFRDRNIPASFGGYRVIEQVWPFRDL